MNSSRLAGSLVFLMIFASIAATTSTLVTPLVSAVFAWIAFFILVRHLPLAMKIQVSVMVFVGTACIAWSVDSPGQVPVVRLLSANHELLALIAAVSFLRLVTEPESTSNEPLPVGRTATLKTLWGLHMFSSVITLSAMMIFGNRIEKDAKINRLHGIMFSRTFAAGCFWSPFYIALATALLYTPGSSLLVLALAGIPVALFGLGLTSWQLLRDREIDTTAGFPVHMDALFVPLALSVLVIVTHLLLPNFPVLTLISILSLLLTLLILVYRKHAGALVSITRHVREELPRVNRELSLFLGAGIMSTGLMTLISTSAFSLGVTTFTVMTGVLLMLASILVSILGVHPLITVSVVGSLLSNTSFEPNLLGVCMVMMWGLGIVISPLSGVNLAIQGRFGLSSFSMMRWNTSYVAALTVFCSALLYLYSSSGIL